MAVTFDITELREFAAELGKAPSVVTRGLPGVVNKGALNIRRDQRTRMASSRHFIPVARSITYDTRSGFGFYEAEIGPRKGSPGSLANIAYFGSSRGGGTVEDPGGALQREVPNFEKALADLAEKALP